jgi:hypothetical protein
LNPLLGSEVGGPATNFPLFSWIVQNSVGFGHVIDPVYPVELASIFPAAVQVTLSKKNQILPGCCTIWCYSDNITTTSFVTNIGKTS